MVVVVAQPGDVPFPSKCTYAHVLGLDSDQRRFFPSDKKPNLGVYLGCVLRHRSMETANRGFGKRAR